MARLSPVMFWPLCVLGILGLWGFAYLDGMFDRLDRATTSLRMPDGRVLRDRYTGNGFLDGQLTLLSAFYEVLTNDRSSGPRLLFFDINAVVSCMSLWVLIESRRRGVRSWFLRWPVWTIVLWNANGAAIFQPVYFYFLTRSRARARDPSIPLADAIALFALALPIMLAPPLLLFAPAWLGATTWSHHGSIALFHLSPIALTVALVLLAFTLRPWTSARPPPLKQNGVIAPTLKKTAHPFKSRITAADTAASLPSSPLRQPRPDAPWIVASLLTAGGLAAAAHLYTVLAALRTADPDASLWRIFVPSLARSGVAGFSPSGVTPTDEYAALLENFHLFSQFDWIVVTLSCVLYAHLLLLPPVDGRLEETAAEQKRRLAYLALGSVVVGPGATGSFVLARLETVRAEKTNVR